MSELPGAKGQVSNVRLHMSDVRCGGRRLTRWVVLVILGAALLSRLLWLDLRPLHHDEGVNSWFATQIASTGQYRYDPTNYHGPVMFFLIAASYLAFGVSAFALRLPAALCGIALVATPLCFRRFRSCWGWLFASLIVLSPSLTFFSRYAIHEPAVLGLSLLSVLVLATCLESQKPAWLPLLAAVIALLLATKETGLIVVFALALASLWHRRQWQAVWAAPGSWPALGWSVVVFCFLYAVFYTSFFTYPQGFSASFLGLAPWAGRGVQGGGHTQPVWFYLGLIARTELPLFVFGLIGLWYARCSVLGRCLAVWLLVMGLAYSLIPYKTPWLLVNITLPLAAVAALGYQRLPPWRVKRVVLAVGLIFLSVMTVAFNYLLPWQLGNPYAYEHTSADILPLVRRIKALAGGQPRILIIADDYWPLPFYWHGLSVEYLRASATPDPATVARFDALVVQDKVYRSFPVPRGSQVQSYQLRPSVRLYAVQPPRVPGVP